MARRATQAGCLSAVLVTGGEGYIGRATVTALLKAGFEPVSIDIRGQPAIRGDSKNAALMQDIIDTLKPVAAVHLAAHSDAAESMREPEKYAENVLMARAWAGLLPVVMASSAAVYGEGDALRETDPLRPVNPYGRSKVLSENELPKAMRLRYFNVAGDHDPNGHIVPRALAAAGTGALLAVHGDAVRDFVHVRDVADANVKALRALLDGTPGQAFNICSGAGISVSEIIARCEATSGAGIKRTPRPPREGDPHHLVGDPAKAKDALGWSPARSLEEIIASAWSARRGPR